MTEKSKLAIFGGKPVITNELSNYQAIDDSDIQVALEVLKSGNLSQFLGDLSPYFYGGKNVQEMEKAWAKYFNVDFAISCNSWTSGLWLSIGALEIDPGSEVIVSSWTMAATATTILHWNLIPVFADIDPKTFNLDLQDVENKITPNTRAIVSPDIFGQSADIEGLRKLCLKHDIYLVSDTAQAPGAIRNEYFAGTKSDIAGFSLNYHKHIHAGEGGVIITNSSKLAERVQLLRNHGEVVVGKTSSESPIFGILGMNMRMGEIQAAISNNQLSKLSNAISSRQIAAKQFSDVLINFEGLQIPYIDEGNSHVYYVYGITIDTESLGLSRQIIRDALVAEGVPALMSGYQNIHSLPLFKKQLTYRSNPLPYSLISRKRLEEISHYELKVAEDLHLNNFLGINWCAKKLDSEDVKLIAKAFEKVWSNLDILRKIDK